MEIGDPTPRQGQEQAEVDNINIDEIQQECNVAPRRCYFFSGCQHLNSVDWHPSLPWERVVQRALELGKGGPVQGSIVARDGTESIIVLDLGFDKLCAFCIGDNDYTEQMQVEAILSGEWENELDLEEELWELKPAWLELEVTTGNGKRISVRRLQAVLDEWKGRAVHEAGHLVTAYLRQRPVEGVNIDPDHAAAELHFGLRDLPLIGPELTADERRRAERELRDGIAIAFGGGIAEALLDQQGPEGWQDEDFMKVQLFASQLAPDAEAAGALAKEIIGQVNTALGQPENMAIVKTLAAALYQDGHLAGQRVREILGKRSAEPFDNESEIADDSVEDEAGG